MKLRPYQQQAVDAVFQEWQEHDSTLVVMPTGTGKTQTFCEVIRRTLAERPGRAMVVAHREELIWQAAHRIEQIVGIRPGIEMADYRSDVGIFDKPRIVVATVQTLNAGRDESGRMGKFDPNEFAILVCDESHHCPAVSWINVTTYFRQNAGLRVLGVTATPDRADEAALGRVFKSVAFHYEILDAINDGWLVPVEQQAVTIDGLDLSGVHTTAGDLNGAELAAVMEGLEDERGLHGIAAPTLEIVGNRKTLVFAASVAHAERLCEIFNRHRPNCARWLCGTTPKDRRRGMLADYADKKFQIVVNVGCLTEGFDDPGIEVIAMARPTKSRSLYAQCAGRATRPLTGIVDRFDDADDRRMAIAESAKPACTIIDFVGNSGRHKLICTADILGGKYEEEVVARAAKKAMESDDAVDMAEALRQCAEELEEEREYQRAREAKNRARLVAKAKYSTQAVDPFDVFHIAPRREMGWDVGRKPSEKMLSLLEGQGIATEGLSFAQARQLIVEVTGRWDKGQCSFKQSKLLQRYGLPGDATRDQAKQWIDSIAANGWRLPGNLAPAAAPVEVF